MKTYDGLCVIWYNLVKALYQEQTVIPLFRPDGGTIYGTRGRESELEAFT